MEAMPHPRPPHLHRQTTRHGKTVWYVRVNHGPRIRMRAAYNTPAFEAEYRAALQGERPAPAAQVPRGNAGVAAGALPGHVGVARPVDGDPPPAREHLQRRHREGGR